MNYSSIIAIIIGLLIVLFSHNDSNIIPVLIQPSAFFIVIGGTFCATLVNFSFQSVKKALKMSVEVFKSHANKKMQVVDEIISIAYFARHNGILALQNVVEQVHDNFLRRGVQLILDIDNPQLLSEILQSEINYEEEEEFINSRIFESMGGYAPTFGIVGAVLGLIQVMSNIQDPQVLAQGIATAFVSTLYGVGIANFIFLPIAGNLKIKLREKMLLKEVILQGLISIKMQESPAVVEEKLIAYLKYNHKNHTIKTFYGENLAK